MKIIQSYWTSSNDDFSKSGGWINKRYELISWSLSYALLKKHFNRVELNGNLAGIEMLTETLGLQYDDVKANLENHIELSDTFWTLKKLYIYAEQNEPFVHVDGDVFWFEKPSDEFLHAEVLAQSLEINDPSYLNSWQNCQKFLPDLPPYLRTEQAKFSLAANLGIVGGTNLSFFKKFYIETLQFLEKNFDILKAHRQDFIFFEVYIEQGLFMCYSSFSNIKAKFLRKPVFRVDFKDVTDFNTISPNCQSPSFIHLLATNKYRIHYCNLMEFWLNKVWPEQLKKIDEICTNHPNFRNNFNILLDPRNEKKLPNSNFISKSPQDVLSNPYIRTSQLLKSNINNTQLELPPIAQTNPDIQKIQDCFLFEKNRFLVLQNLLQIVNPDTLYEHFEQHLTFCSLSLEDRLHSFIEINRSKVLKSHFNWFNDLIYNVDYYYYNLLVSSDRVCFQELLLTEFECQLLNLLNEKITIQELIEKWCQKNNIKNTPQTTLKIDNILRELIAYNLIIWSK